MPAFALFALLLLTSAGCAVHRGPGTVADRIAADSASFSRRCARSLAHFANEPDDYMDAALRTEFARQMSGWRYTIVSETDARLTDPATGDEIRFERGQVAVLVQPRTSARVIGELARQAGGRATDVHWNATGHGHGIVKIEVSRGAEIPAALALLYDCRVALIHLNIRVAPLEHPPRLMELNSRWPQNVRAF